MLLKYLNRCAICFNRLSLVNQQERWEADPARHEPVGWEQAASSLCVFTTLEYNIDGISVIAWPFAKEVVILYSRQPGIGERVRDLSIR